MNHGFCAHTAQQSTHKRDKMTSLIMTLSRHTLPNISHQKSLDTFIHNCHVAYKNSTHLTIPPTNLVRNRHFFLFIILYCSGNPVFYL